MITLTFNKEESNRWFVDLPTWTGPKDDLEMVMGADTFLDILSEAESSVTLNMSTSEYPNSELLVYLNEEYDGAFYHLESYSSIEFNLDIWLCHVTKFVFGDFPTIIYFNKI